MSVPLFDGLGRASQRSEHVRSASRRFVYSTVELGRWGETDQKGTVNLITPETRIRAARLVQSGNSVSMAHEVLEERTADNFSPYEHRMTSIGSSPGPWSGDFIGVSYHGYAHSHLDALCHRFQFGTMYNGYSEDEVTEEGCAQLSIQAMQDGIFGRGIVMDFPRLRGVDWLENGTAIMPEWLDEWESTHGITVGSGDIVLIELDAGRAEKRLARGIWPLTLQVCMPVPWRGSKKEMWL